MNDSRAENRQSDYLKAFEDGALAAIAYIAEQWPDLAEASDDLPGVTTATTEHIGDLINTLRGLGV